MPTCATVQHVEDDVLVHEEEVAFHLLVELVCKFRAADVCRSWASPLPAYRAAVHNVWNHVQNFVGYANSFEESAHSEF